MRSRSIGIALLTGLTLAMASACAQTEQGQASNTSSGPLTEMSTTATDVTPVPSSGELTSDGFTAEIHWNNGSLPAPYAYQWTFTVDGSRARFVWETSYGPDDEKEWSEDITLTTDQIENYVAALNAAGVTDRSLTENGSLAGGPYGKVVLADTTGTAVDINLGANDVSQGVLNKVEPATLALVPKDAYDSIKAEYDAWSADHDG